jgi:hypothetical protein
VVEHRLAKARVEGSNPFSRSISPGNHSVIGGFLWVTLQGTASLLLDGDAAVSPRKNQDFL